MLFCPMAKDFAALDDRLSEAMRLLFAEMKIPGDRVEKYLAKAGKCILTKSESRQEIGRLIQVCKDLEYGPITEEWFRKNALFQTEISMWCCDRILWSTEDKRVVSAIDSTRENIGLGEI